ncbi:TetR/AcrR family transcriptional regulator [Halorarius halobius]|uniref:TetR/AcrR family transcriptional regulator n=1 Tax=Halorarius halobius TaxID=2962671 RepID=UPI0020CCC072|nr:TetR/AcrR family transcriptional regulator [Halorarius halobius]
MGDAEPNDTEAAIMEATYEALSAHGHADLTIQGIADAFPKSKSLLYYHYDDKDAILQAFLDWVIEEFRSEMEGDLNGRIDDPRAALEALLDELLPRTFDGEDRTFRVAILALQAQAPHDPAYAEGFEELYDAIEAMLVGVVERGVDSGAFQDVDPERTARLLLAVASGGVTWTLSTDSDASAEVRDVLDGYVESQLYA